MVNDIEFEEVETRLFSDDLQTPEYQAINPMKKVPAIAHGDFTLFESHAILMYLACSYHVPDHWYPADLCKRAKLQSLLDWHHSNLRYGSMGYLVNTILAQFLGKLPNHDCAADCEKKLVESFSTIETMLPDEERNRLIGPYKKVQQWVEDVKEATNPHFDEVHKYLFDVIATLKQKA
uniref:GST N-terminal domain-containing protein n=1 Tax=Chenopodium quinoa TaxID=63459 RepID=A0A803LQK4_CHEQI